MRSCSRWTALFLAGVLQYPATIVAQESPFEIGMRGLVLLGKGTPANDMIGEGLIGRFALSDAWRLGVALDGVTFDYETPNRALGIPATTVVDGSNSWSRVSVLVERRFESERRWRWHWLAGLGHADVEPVSNVTGRRADGGTFDIATTVHDELHVFAGGGAHREIKQRWLLDTTLTIEHHDTHYELVDLVSGARGTIDAQTVYGIAVGVGYRF
ncbi:MAG TPA: hypothetical protein VGL98_13030 [Gammaproteobacteria bacterium]